MRKLRNNKKKLFEIKSKVAELIREQETTRQDIDLLTSTIHHLKEQMDKIEQTCFHINTRPFVNR